MSNDFFQVRLYYQCLNSIPVADNLHDLTRNLQRKFHFFTVKSICLFKLRTSRWPYKIIYKMTFMVCIEVHFNFISLQASILEISKSLASWCSWIVSTCHYGISTTRLKTTFIPSQASAPYDKQSNIQENDNDVRAELWKSPWI